MNEEPSGNKRVNWSFLHAVWLASLRCTGSAWKRVTHPGNGVTVWDVTGDFSGGIAVL